MEFRDFVPLCCFHTHLLTTSLRTFRTYCSMTDEVNRSPDPYTWVGIQLVHQQRGHHINITLINITCLFPVNHVSVRPNHEQQQQQQLLCEGARRKSVSWIWHFYWAEKHHVNKSKNTPGYRTLLWMLTRMGWRWWHCFLIWIHRTQD